MANYYGKTTPDCVELLRNFVDEIAPRHDRTSCSDADFNGNQYFNELGYPRCTRCALLYRLENGKWPHGAVVKSSGILFTGNERIVERP